MPPDPTWYTVVTFGQGIMGIPFPPVGPWHSVAQAETAIWNWTMRLESNGINATRQLAALTARLAGPFTTLDAAIEADISTAPVVRPL